MKANEYIKKNSLEEARKLLGMGRCFVELSDGSSFHTDELLHFVESHQIVESCGGLDKVKQDLIAGNVFRFEEKPLMRKAVADVESCQ